MKLFATIIITLVALSSLYADWTEPVRISEPGGCLYPQILAQDDTLHVVYTNASGGYYIGYVRSIDGGESWADPRVLCDTNATDIGIFAKILRFEQCLIVIWRNTDYGVRPYNLGYAVSLNSGSSWSAPQFALNVNLADIQYYSAQGSDSIVSIIFNSSSYPELAFYSFRSTDFGQHWSEPVELFRATQAGIPDGAAADNIYHFVWDGRFDWVSSDEIYYVRSTDRGLTWDVNRPLSEVDIYHSQFPAIFTNALDGVALTWMDFKDSPSPYTGDIFLRLSRDSGATWIAELQLTNHHYARQSDVITASDTIHVVWMDARPGIGHSGIFYLRSTDGGSTWGDEYWLDADSSLSADPALAASTNKIFAVWAEDRLIHDSTGSGVYFSRYDAEPNRINQELVPRTLAELAAYPNPFNTATVITYSNIDNSEIGIASITGQIVKTFNIENRKEGQVVWDGTNSSGKPVASGLYFVRVGASADDQGLKLIYLK